MNLTAIKYGVLGFLKRTGSFMKRNAPQIMVGTGLAAGGATVVLACKATLKTQDIMDAKDEALLVASTPEETKNVKRVARVRLVKTWAPVGTVAAASVALILGGQGILGRRAAEALGVAYKAQTELFKRDQAIEEAFGKDIAQKIKQGLPIGKEELEKGLAKAEEKRVQKAEEKKLTAGTDDGEYEVVEFYFCEATCGSRFWGGGTWTPDPQTNLATVRGFLNSAQDRLDATGHLTINELFTDIMGKRAEGRGFKGDHGWVSDPVYGRDTVDFGPDVNALLSDKSDAYWDFVNGENPNIMFRFRVRKTPIIEYIDEINERRKTGVKQKAALGGYSARR